MGHVARMVPTVVTLYSEILMAAQKITLFTENWVRVLHWIHLSDDRGPVGGGYKNTQNFRFPKKQGNS